MDRVAQNIGYGVLLILAVLVGVFIFISVVNMSIIAISEDEAFCSYSGDSGNISSNVICVDKETDNDY